MFRALADVHAALTFFILFTPHERIKFGDLSCSEWVLCEHNSFDLCSFLVHYCPFIHDFYLVFSAVLDILSQTPP